MLGSELLLSSPVGHIALHTSEMAKGTCHFAFSLCLPLPPSLPWHKNIEKTVHPYEAPRGEVPSGDPPELPELWNQGPCGEALAQEPPSRGFNQAAFKPSRSACDYAGCLHHL